MKQERLKLLGGRGSTPSKSSQEEGKGSRIGQRQEGARIPF